MNICNGWFLLWSGCKMDEHLSWMICPFNYFFPFTRMQNGWIFLMDDFLFKWMIFPLTQMQNEMTFSHGSFFPSYGWFSCLIEMQKVWTFEMDDFPFDTDELPQRMIFSWTWTQNGWASVMDDFFALWMDEIFIFSLFPLPKKKNPFEEDFFVLSP